MSIRNEMSADDQILFDKWLTTYASKHAFLIWKKDEELKTKYGHSFSWDAHVEACKKTGANPDD